MSNEPSQSWPFRCTRGYGRDLRNWQTGESEGFPHKEKPWGYRDSSDDHPYARHPLSYGRARKTARKAKEKRAARKFKYRQ